MSTTLGQQRLLIYNNPLVDSNLLLVAGQRVVGTSISWLLTNALTFWNTLLPSHIYGRPCLQDSTGLMSGLMRVIVSLRGTQGQAQTATMSENQAKLVG